MQCTVVCNMVTPGAFAVTREDKTIILSTQDPYVYAVNPDVELNGEPLITYAERGGWQALNSTIGAICTSTDDGDFFVDDASVQFGAGYPLCQQEKEHVIDMAKTVCLTYKTEKQGKATIRSSE